MMRVGFRIGAPAPAVDQTLLARFADLPAAVISDAMHRLFAGGAALQPIGTARLCAPALTIRTAPGDNLMVHKALDIARPGQVLVIDASGDLSNAIIGERMLLIAEDRGLAGFIINGAVRDAGVLRQSRLPIYAAGVTHRGPYKNGPGEINFPIAIGGMVIAPGDIIVGDEDGLVSIPLADAFEVCAEAEKKARQENDNDPRTESRAWIDQRLAELGCGLAANRNASAAMADILNQ